MVDNVHQFNKPGWRVQGPILDTLVNLLSGLGTAKDKTTHSRFVMTTLDREQLLSAYRGDWVARKIVDAPAQDSTREWRHWEADKTDITKIEEAEQNYRLQFKVKQVMQRARLWGGSALVMGVDQGRPEQELRVDRVRAGSLKFVHVINRDDIVPDELERDVNSEFYGEPKSYTVRSGTGGMVKIHPSRVIRFIGNEVPDINVSTDGWGDSILQVIYDAVVQASQTSANVASYVNEAKVDVVQIPDLMNNMGTAEYRGRLIERFTVANTMKSLTNTLMLDKEEEWNRITASFGGLPDLIKIYLLMASGAADIPATRLLGQSAVGLGATGESDTRNYYDRLSSDQKNDLGPMLDRLDEVMIRSALGDKPDDLFYEWNSLWQLTDQEKADVATKKATVYTADVNAGLIPPEVLREGRENQLIEDGTYPGLESALEEYGEQNLDEYNQAVIAQMGARAALMAPDDPNDPKGGSKKAKAAQAEFKRRRALPPPRPPAARQDDSWTDDHLVSRGRARYTPAFDETTPRSLYVRRDVLNGDEILAHFAEQGVDVSVVDPEELHVTILYSRQPVDWIKMGEAMSYGPVNYSRADEESDEEYDMCVRAGGPRVMEAYGTPPDTLVMCFASSALTWRHQDMVYRGASHDYDDYNPHLSIAPWDGTDPREIEPWTGEIELGPEIFEPTKVGGAGGAAADYDPDQLRDPGEDETEVEDYNPNQPRDKRGRWSGGGGGSGGSGASGRSSTGGTSRSKSGVKKGARAKREKLPDLSDPKRLAKYRQNTDFIRRLNQANEDRPTFESVMADLSASKVTKAQLITILKDYRFTRNYEYSARMSRERLLNALRVEFTDNKRFKNKIAASGKGSLLGLDVDDYSPDQPRVPGGQEGGGQFTTQGGTGYSRVLTKAGIYTRLFKVKRLDGGQSFNAKYKKEPINPEGNPQIVEVAQQVRGVKGKWNKNTDQAGDFAAGAGWLTLKEFPELGMFADQFWRDAAEFMTPREYKYAQSHFATRTKAFTEGFRATYSPNGRAFGLSRARTSEVFGRSTTQMRSGIDSVFAPKKPGFVAGMGERVAKFFGV